MKKRSDPRTPAECLEVLGWSARRFSREAGADDRTVRRWLDGTADMPAALVEWLDGLATRREAMPPAVRRWLDSWDRFAQETPAPPWRVRNRAESRA